MIHKEILQQSIQGCLTDQQKIENLANVFVGKTALVISAGPSAVKWKEIYEAERSENPIIVCVKQSINLPELNALCDIHFYNPYNLVKWNYVDSNTFKVFTTTLDTPKTYCDYDLKFQIIKKSDNLDSTLVVTQNFSDYTLKESGIHRPWGPGIMHESVIYTLIHMGITRIVTVGWDIADSQGQNKHFYDTKNSNCEFFNRFFNKIRLRSLYNFYLYKTNQKYNYAGMLPGEAKATSESIQPLIAWLKDYGVELIIHSQSRWMDN